MIFGVLCFLLMLRKACFRKKLIVYLVAKILQECNAFNIWIFFSFDLLYEIGNHTLFSLQRAEALKMHIEEEVS